MKGIITHEESQAVTSAFLNAGHDFYSNDLQDCSGNFPDRHWKGDCFYVTREIQVIKGGIDFWGAHPDCSRLTNSGIRWLTSKNQREGYVWNGKIGMYYNPVRWEEMEKSCLHFLRCYDTLKQVGRGYIENPRMHPYAARIINIQSTQYVHPYFFGTPQMKETHLWIIGLPELKPTNKLTPPKDKRERLKWQNIWMASPGPERAKQRSKTDRNFAAAMALQWE